MRMHATAMLLARVIPDWNSLDSVRRVHSVLSVAALIGFALLVLFDVLAHLSKEDNRKRLLEEIALYSFALAVLAEIIAYPYGERNDTLSAQIIGSLDAKAREALLNASDATTKANNANLKSDSANLLSGNASTLAKGARLEADSFEKEIVSAKRLATDANSHLADALQRVAELQERTNPRHILDEKKTRALSLLMSNAKGSINISCQIPDKEPCDFAGDIAELLNSAGWSVTGPSGRMMVEAPSGIPVVGLSVTVFANPPPPRAIVLQKVFEKIGFSVVGKLNPNVPKDDVDLYVGIKP